MGIWEGSLGCEFLRGWMWAEGMGCGRRWVDGDFGEQGLPAGIQECLERFHRRCVDYLSRQPGVLAPSKYLFTLSAIRKILGASGDCSYNFRCFSS